MKNILVTIATILSVTSSFAQSKITIGIMPFTAQDGGYYQRTSAQISAVQDEVTDIFLDSKRFSLVERSKMDQISNEKKLQKGEDFIDGSVIEQSKSLGAQYIVIGNVTKANVTQSQSHAPLVGVIYTDVSEVAFNIKVVDVTTGIIIASNSFDGSGKGKNAYENALKDVKPDVQKFIQDNFKLVVSIAGIEEKDNNGIKKVLISGGTSVGMTPGNELKVYEASELMVDGKKMTRKVTIGKIKVSRVDDENFSVCDVLEGNSEIAKKMESGAKIKCELISAPVAE